jgi:hypothetical protein
MADLSPLLEDLVTANRILAAEGVVDSFGHISVRHPDNPKRYLLSRARAPDCIEVDDIMEFELDGTAVDARGRAPYRERHIHGAIYEARPPAPPPRATRLRYRRGPRCASRAGRGRRAPRHPARRTIKARSSRRAATAKSAFAADASFTDCCNVCPTSRPLIAKPLRSVG